MIVTKYQLPTDNTYSPALYGVRRIGEIETLNGDFTGGWTPMDPDEVANLPDDPTPQDIVRIYMATKQRHGLYWQKAELCLATGKLFKLQKLVDHAARAVEKALTPEPEPAPGFSVVPRVYLL